ncbi:MAG: GNAT family N-acetyltransferase [Sulfitobacter sp.]
MLSDGYHDIPAGKVAMIVTHLEMRSPAFMRPIPLPEGVTLHRFDPDFDAYRDLYTRVGALEWLWFSRLELSRDALMSTLRDPLVEIYTLRKDGRNEALLELDFRAQGSCELAFFGLTPALIGTGCGRLLMNEAITRAWAKPITRFHVHTCTIDSPQALSFYRRSGFTAIRQQVEIANDPRLFSDLPETAGPHVPIFRP